MIVNYNIEKISRAFDDFYNVTGVNISLRGTDRSSVPTISGIKRGARFCDEIVRSGCGYEACRCSDARLVEKCAQSKHAECHVCHAGLTDIAVPLTVGDEIIGYIILGQMRNDSDFSAIEERIAQYGVPMDKMREYYSQLKYFDSYNTQSVINIAVMLAKYMLLEDMLGPRRSENIDKAAAYIHANLENNISVHSISAGANVSKSVLYRDFRKYLGCTVNEYINSQRVERAAALLLDSESSIGDVARAVGFSSSSYFGKIFTKVKGITPVKYRNLHKKRPR